jgi:site-specific DNA recombinase
MKRIHGAFIYARYSTDNQNPDSIDVQVSKGAKWCDEHSLPVLGIYADEAISGMKDSRPDYDRMMMHLELGKADTVVIYDQSRMFRKMTAWFAFRDQLSNMGVTVCSVTQPLIGKDLRDPTNFLTEGSMALFNQIWALQSRQKTMEKLRFMARNGQHTGGKPALGYMIEDGKLVICEPEAEVVRRIFNEYVSGVSYRDIIAGLNRDGIKTKRGNAFGSNSLHDMLKNEKYIGTLVYGQSPYRPDGTRNTHAKDGADVIRIENAIPAIIDKKTFEKVQKKMALNKRQQGGRPPKNRNYPLKGKVYCGYCKSALSVSISKGEYYYYKCTSKKRKHDCDGVSISVDSLESAVVDAVKKVLGTPENMDTLIRILRDSRENLNDGAYSLLRTLINERDDTRRKLDNAVNAVLDGLESPALRTKMKSLENRLAEIEEEMISLKHKVDAAAIPEDQLMRILNTIVKGESGRAKEAILSIVYRVEVTDEDITIWTILDADPSGRYDFDEEGVLITPGTTSSVPIVFITPQFLRIVVVRNKDTFS